MEEQNQLEQNNNLQPIDQAIQFTNEKPAVENKFEKSPSPVRSKNKKWGLFWILGPMVGVIVALLGIVIINAISANLGVGNNVPSIATIIINIIQFLLGLIGFVSIICFTFGIPLGIILLTRREISEGVIYDERSGNGKNSVGPEEIKGWSWGASSLNWIWGIANRVWISLLIFIPLVNIVMFFVLGFKGNEWAWKAQKWESVEVFKAHQRKWNFWGIIILLLGALGWLAEIVIKLQN